MILQKVLFESFNKFSVNETCAVCCGELNMTYHELDCRSKVITSKLVSRSKTYAAVGVISNHRHDYIISALGILYAQQIFCPIDYKYPDRYIADIIEQAEIKILLCGNECMERIHGIQAMLKDKIQILSVSENMKYGDARSIPILDYLPDDPVYIYFTSGTTGKHKAILGKNKSLVHFLLWEKNILAMKENVRVSQFTSPSHDPFLRDIFYPLISGGTIYIPEEATVQNNEEIVSWLNESQVNVVHCTPSFFKNLAPPYSTFDNYPDLKFILLAGEKVCASDLEAWYQQFGNRIQLINLYGPTETTLAKAFHFIHQDDLKTGEIPIGKPIDDTKLLILDENMIECTNGQSGEIYIITPYMTHGYLNDGTLQEQRFITFNHGLYKGLAYKTGDCGTMNEEKDILFIGRKDKQIKYRGYRIELQVIEDTIKEITGITDAVVVFNEVNGAIIAYYLTLNQFDTQDLNDQLTKRLPWYMIPTNFVRLDKIPLTENYKIDYQKLPMPEIISQNMSMSEMEMMLYELWSELLDCREIGLNDNFFYLGGHSMLLLKMQYELSLRGIEVEIDKLFVNQTISSLVKLLESITSCK